MRKIRGLGNWKASTHHEHGTNALLHAIQTVHMDQSAAATVDNISAYGPLDLLRAAAAVTAFAVKAFQNRKRSMSTCLYNK